ncbi:MAG: diacylglycerol/lipid kinase family protein [Leucobacter sp.]
MTSKIGIVWNPSKADGDKLKAAFASALEAEVRAPDTGDPDAEHIQALWFETTPEDPGQGASSEALDAGCTVIVAAGGDGTVRAVAERLGGGAGFAAAPAPVNLGIVPLGTGNLLARNLAVPLGDPEAAFRRILAGSPAPLDLGEVSVTFDDERENANPAVQGFVVMAGFGIDAQMIAETDDDLKAKTGWLAYVESLGRAMESTEVVDLTLTLDGESTEGSAHTLLVANCGTIQGGVTLVPDAVPDDGELDLLLLNADGVASWLDTMRNMMWDNGLKRLIVGGDKAESSDSTAHLRAREVQVNLAEPLVFEVDGDEIGAVRAFSVRVLPAALRVL